MNAEDHLKCPVCGTPVSAEDKFCKSCGTDLSVRRVISVQESFEQEDQPAESYERKFPFFKRFWQVLVSPREGMKDVGLAPDYLGPVLILVIQAVVSGVSSWFIMHRINIVGGGEDLSYVWSTYDITLSVSIYIASAMFFVFWLVKSYLVDVACDSGSEWGYATAASVTGYAYIADLVTSVLNILIVWLIAPVFTFDISSAAAAEQSARTYYTQIKWAQFLYTLPLFIVGLVWKSYLGALGSHFGTKGNCKVSGAFLIFFALGLVSIAWTLFNLIQWF
jgi:hypothetical protein